MELLRLGVALVLLAACDDVARECYPGDYKPCTCEGGEEGFEQCNAAGDAYGECLCEGEPLGGGAGEGGGALLPFMSECEDDGECDTGNCYDFNAKGPHCSHACELDEDCEPPSPGCNMMGICKVP